MTRSVRGLLQEGRVAGLALLALVSAGELTATEIGHDKKWVAWQAQWENDAFAVFGGSDRYYTNGIRLSYLRHPAANPRWAEKIRRAFGDSYFLNFGTAFGQNFYTPEEITRAELDPLDRPWAGWLYGGPVLQLTRADHRVQHLIEGHLGVVGAIALSESLQKGIHEILADDRPEGWDNQLEFEPQVNFNYLWRRKIGGSTADFVPHAGVTVGTLMDFVSAGGTLRVGRNISNFPALPIVPTVLLEPVAPAADRDPDRSAVAAEARSAAERQPPSGEGPGATPRARVVENEGARRCGLLWADECQLFVGGDGRFVAHNVFLDGTNWRDSHRVDKEEFVYDLKAGFSLRWGNYRLTYTFVRRSREFEVAPGRGDGVHDFGSVSFSFERRKGG